MAMFRKKDPKEEFLTAVRKTLRTLGVSGPAEYDDEGFALRLGDDSAIMLGNLFARWQTLPKAEARAYLGTAIGGLLVEADQPKTFEAARSRLMPGIRDRSTVESARWMSELSGTPRPTIPHQSLGSTIVGVLVLDSPTTMSMVNADLLSEWEVSFDEAFSAAIENLSATTETARWHIDDAGVYASTWNDDYDVSRLLLPNVIDALDLSGDPVAMVPHRNRLIVVGAEDDKGIQAAMARTASELDQPSQVSAIPLVRIDGEWTDFDLPAGHPASQALQHLRAQDRALAYGATTSIIQSVVGEELFVANHMLAEIDDALVSIATWIDGPSIIPEVDRVMFFRSEQENWTVEWRHVVANVGHLLAPTSFYPPRYRVEAFPTAEQLQAMPLVLD